MMHSPDDICAAIRQADGILLTTHCNPDGDGIGSQIALFHVLSAAGRRVFMHNFDGVPRIYRFLEGSEHVGSGAQVGEDDFDLIVSLDAGSRSRLGFADDALAGRKLAVIDHHATNECFGDLNLVDVSACATGAIVLDLIRRMQLPVSPAAANALYVTLLTDTTSFRNAGTTAPAHRMAADLIDAGAEPWPLARAVYESRTRAGFDLQMRCMQTLELHDGGKSAWLFVDEAMYRETGSDCEDTEGLIDLARALDGVQVAVFMRPGENGVSWKVTFRGKYDADVGALAASLGGGGHRHAAGCTMRGGFDEVRDKVARAVRALLG